MVDNSQIFLYTYNYNEVKGGTSGVNLADKIVMRPVASLQDRGQDGPRRGAGDARALQDLFDFYHV